ncbi:MAG: AAA family ATPase [Verrucomicrobia bacterium]|nr:AAA family ATPase [Verrucomicrobiota bacterium]
MLTALTLTRFKSFSDTRNKLSLGQLSLIIGTNASGKSNLRDGLRFIHGISRGYSLAEVIGEKYIEGGVLQWKGIRGGVRETVLRNGGPQGTQFSLSVESILAVDNRKATYSITVDVGDKEHPPFVAAESLIVEGKGKFIFHTQPDGEDLNELPNQRKIFAQVRKEARAGFSGPKLDFRRDQPILSQICDHSETKKLPAAREYVTQFLQTIASIRFLDLEPPALRRPSIPGQTILGDKGENLSSVLQAICADKKRREALIEWTRELTPLDVIDFRFPDVSLEGKIQLQLVEAGGREISAESASDGTLRFLAFAAALLGTDPARCYFFEEMENGIHPNRAYLLIQLLKTATKDGTIQVIGTTHSPSLLNFLDDAALHDASLVYRADGKSKVRSFRDLPDLWKIHQTSSAGQLHSSGWFENAATFLEGDDQP